MSWQGDITSNNIKIWVDSGTVSATLSGTFFTSTVSTTDPYHIGRGTSTAMANGSRVYAWAFVDGFLTDTLAGGIRDLWVARHNGTRY